jgi:E3 ubiquitin-protein ligase MYCBP2
MNKTCNKVLACGHSCNGFVGEGLCLPCLDEACVSLNKEATMEQKADDYCSICYTDGLGQGPCVILQCKHIFHLECVMSKIKAQWNGARIGFAFMDCPSCKREIKAQYCGRLEAELKQPRILKE